MSQPSSSPSPSSGDRSLPLAAQQDVRLVYPDRCPTCQRPWNSKQPAVADSSHRLMSFIGAICKFVWGVLLPQNYCARSHRASSNEILPSSPDLVGTPYQSHYRPRPASRPDDHQEYGLRYGIYFARQCVPRGEAPILTCVRTCARWIQG